MTTDETAEGEAETHDEAGAPEGEPARIEPAPKPPELATKRPSPIFLAVVSLVSLAADLASKYWVTSHLDDPNVRGAERLAVIQGHITFIFAKNKGGAWGLLQDESESIRRPFFVLISLGAVIFILSLYRKLAPEQKALKWGLPLVLGGALGNLVDRIRYGHVVDFIDVRVTESFHWPTFNVADIAICVGVGLMAVDMFTSRKPKPARSGDDASPTSIDGAASSEGSQAR